MVCMTRNLAYGKSAIDTPLLPELYIWRIDCILHVAMTISDITQLVLGDVGRHLLYSPADTS